MANNQDKSWQDWLQWIGSIILMALGLSLPLPNIAGTKPPKPDPTREQFALAMNEGVTRKVTAFAVERAKLTAVEAATTAEELVAI